MFRILFLLFVFIPIIEITVLIQVGNLLGLWPTVAIVIITAWLGANKVKQQGVATLASVQTKMAQGQMPSDEIVTGLMLLVAGVLLITPGFVTDIFGLALLIPSARAQLGKFAQRHFVTIQTAGFSQGSFEHTQARHSTEFPADHPPHQGQTLEGEFERKD
jgi:UPF0716 protein FxsA